MHRYASRGSCDVITGAMYYGWMYECEELSHGTVRVFRIVPSRPFEDDSDDHHHHLHDGDD